MLWSKVIGAGGSLGGGVSMISLVTTISVVDATTITIPASAQVGDVVFICAGGAAPNPTPDTGWTINTDTSGIWNLRTISKVLVLSDLGSTITVLNSTSVSQYGTILLYLFRPNATVSTINISSIDDDGESATFTTKTKVVTLSPSIVIAIRYVYNFSFTSYTQAFSGTFWDNGQHLNNNLASFASAYNIQNDTSDNRDIIPGSISSSYQHLHSFVVNLA